MNQDNGLEDDNLEPSVDMAGNGNPEEPASPCWKKKVSNS